MAARGRQSLKAPFAHETERQTQGCVKRCQLDSSDLGALRWTQRAAAAASRSLVENPGMPCSISIGRALSRCRAVVETSTRNRAHFNVVLLHRATG